MVATDKPASSELRSGPGNRQFFMLSPHVKAEVWLSDMGVWPMSSWQEHQYFLTQHLKQLAQLRCTETEECPGALQTVHMIFLLIHPFSYSLFCEPPAHDFPQEKLICKILDLKKITMKPTSSIVITLPQLCGSWVQGRRQPEIPWEAVSG